MMGKRFYILGLLLPVVTLVSGVLEKEFKWLDITPTTNLIFHDCFSNHQCARLDVPMDYNRTDGKGSRVALAIIKIPAKVPVTDPRYGGSILLNPGGPGESGVSIIFQYGQSFQTIVDSPSHPDDILRYEDGKYFDIMSFDPRGVNNTTPQVICFPNLESRDSWTRSMRSEGTISSSEVSFATKWARYLAVTESCVQRMNLVAEDDEGEDNLLEHVNTAPVVGDMVSIVEALGEWREAEALRILDSKMEVVGGRLEAKAILMAPWRLWQRRTQEVLETSSTYDAKREEIIERTKWKHGEEKLLYWGLSYGTVLGATFAAMQPQRVGRLILDGVVDSEDYYTAEFKMNLNDAEDVFSKFFHYCSLAGPTKCAFSSSESETASSLRQKFNTLLKALKENPIPVYATTSTPFTGPGIITSSDLLIFIRSTLYSPLQTWPALAQILQDLQNGNGTSFSSINNSESSEENGESSCATKCEEAYSAECQGPKLGEDPQMSGSVWCADGLPVDGVSGDEFKNTTLKQLMEQSELFGDIWAELRMQCVGWRVRPKWRYGGVFKDVKTSHPIFWIGTTGDPVCPMINAYKMESSFPGSVALEQTSQGHCSISGPSLCTASHVRKYFQTGKLPAPGTICGVDHLPFEEQAEIDISQLDSEDKELWEAIKDFDGF